MRRRPDHGVREPFSDRDQGISAPHLRQAGRTRRLDRSRVDGQAADQLGPYCSVCFEVWYYALFALVVFGSRSARWIGTPLLPAPLGPKIAVCLALWLTGVTSYRITTHLRIRSPGVAARLVGGMLLLMMAPVIYVAIKHLVPFGRAMYHGFTWDRVSFRSWAYLASLGVGLACTLFGVNMLAPFLTRIAGHVEQPIRWVAGGTFTLYLVHQPILLCLAAVLDPFRASLRGPCVAGGTLVLCYALGERRKTLWRHAGLTLLSPLVGAPKGG